MRRHAHRRAHARRHARAAHLWRSGNLHIRQRQLHAHSAPQRSAAGRALTAQRVKQRAVRWVKHAPAGAWPQRQALPCRARDQRGLQALAPAAEQARRDQRACRFPGPPTTGTGGASASAEPNTNRDLTLNGVRTRCIARATSRRRESTRKGSEHTFAWQRAPRLRRGPSPKCRRRGALSRQTN